MLHINSESLFELSPDDDEYYLPSRESVEFSSDLLRNDPSYIDESITYIYRKLPTPSDLVAMAYNVVLDARIDESERTYMARKNNLPQTPEAKAIAAAASKASRETIKELGAKAQSKAKRDLPIKDPESYKVEKVLEASTDDFPVIQTEDTTIEEVEVDVEYEFGEPTEAELDEISADDDEEIRKLEEDLAAAVNLPSQELEIRARALQAARQRRWREKQRQKIVGRGARKVYKNTKGTQIYDGMETLHVIMGTHLNSDLYKQGANVGPRLMYSENKFGMKARSNAFERLMSLQRTLETEKATPKWIIITKDDVSIMDPYFERRLAQIENPNTVAVGAFGVNAMRISGRWWEDVNSNELVGQFFQGSVENPLFMRHIIAPNFHEERYVNGFRAACITSGMIAVRGSFFRSIDFEPMASQTAVGYQHFIPMISIEANKKKKVVGVIRTLIRQEDRTADHKAEEGFNQDHRAFVRAYFDQFPLTVK